MMSSLLQKITEIPNVKNPVPVQEWKGRVGDFGIYKTDVEDRFLCVIERDGKLMVALIGSPLLGQYLQIIRLVAHACGAEQVGDPYPIHIDTREILEFYQNYRSEMSFLDSK